MMNVRRQSRHTWISRNIDSMLFVVFCPLQLGQGSGVAQGLSVTGNSRTRGRGLGFLDDEGPVAIATDVDLSQQRFHSLDRVLRTTIRAGERHVGGSAHGQDTTFAGRRMQSRI
jgi:hypothetical protein